MIAVPRQRPSPGLSMATALHRKSAPAAGCRWPQPAAVVSPGSQCPRRRAVRATPCACQRRAMSGRHQRRRRHETGAAVCHQRRSAQLRCSRVSPPSVPPRQSDGSGSSLQALPRPARLQPSRNRTVARDLHGRPWIGRLARRAAAPPAPEPEGASPRTWRSMPPRPRSRKLTLSMASDDYDSKPSLPRPPK